MKGRSQGEKVVYTRDNKFQGRSCQMIEEFGIDWEETGPKGGKFNCFKSGLGTIDNGGLASEG